MKTPVVDKDKCIGCGTCTVLVGKTFKLRADGKAEVIVPAGDEEKTIQEAIDSCPVQAITWKES
ncbi:ferredoxin [Candidatus Shapirobacteria bacterium CG08_land_8_20_14_0_20_39_18]|uniref:Ferredoxin n=1 Tax=Candidatus Shapirobacteria bacterium CG08_land_8_20_14_0_20_39_18 TaxID=1974883 RepID=A0A2M6XCF9_9BACT|nr:MAG: ferredoxin [Candidatus Shapirobacteria bacterium CG08_land_8_20_14_0_20_39_18]PIY65554.1 MAG: ferredoxin [Candidatus Shapirobacteria bacterium CG_4_10_14_0_8_um_filter_39_15]